MTQSLFSFTASSPLGKLGRILGAVACIAASIFVTAPKPAAAAGCSIYMAQINDCNWVADTICTTSSGGHYLQKAQIVTIC